MEDEVLTDENLYQQILAGLCQMIHESLNPNDDDVRMGFACFVYPITDQTKIVSLVSNTGTDVVSSIIRKFLKIADDKEKVN